MCGGGRREDGDLLLNKYKFALRKKLCGQIKGQEISDPHVYIGPFALSLLCILIIVKCSLSMENLLKEKGRRVTGFLGEGFDVIDKICIL